MYEDEHLESDYEDRYTLQNDIDAEDEDLLEEYEEVDEGKMDIEDEPDYIRLYPNRFDKRRYPDE